MSSPWKAILGVVLIFIFGCFSGWLSASLFHAHQTEQLLKDGPDAVARVLERRMTHSLDLDNNQQRQIHAFILENLQQRRDLQKGIQPQIQVLNRQTLQQINTVLEPGQQERLRENISQFKKRFGRNPFNPNAENPPPPPPRDIPTNSGAGAPPKGP